MSDTIRDLLVRGIAAVKSGDSYEALRYLNWLMRLNPSIEEKKEAWFWMSEASDNPMEKRKFLEEILAHDPWDSRARRALAVVDGKLKPEEIIDPNQAPAIKTDEQPQPTNANRFVCPKCGGRMVYKADGYSLECEYCLSRERATTGRLSTRGSEEADFIIGLATARGHLKPEAVQAVTCRGCGAEFIVAPAQISQSCPYCRSAYVLSQIASKQIISPNGLIPLSVTEDEARQALRNWFTRQSFSTRPGVAPGLGMYLPVWCFDMGGQMTLRCQTQRGKEWVEYSEQRPVQQRDLLVMASKRLPETLHSILFGYDLSKIQPYDERYLVSWPAESYQISMADASLIARQQSFTWQKEHDQAILGAGYRNVSYSSAGMLIESYQLLLIPVWVTQYQLDGETCAILINGQTTDVVAQQPRSGGNSWISRLTKNR